MCRRLQRTLRGYMRVGALVGAIALLGSSAWGQQEGDQACCLPDGQCVDQAPADCQAQGGIAQGPASACVDVQCISINEACCLPGGGCAVTSREACLQAGGSPQGPDTDCLDAQCPEPEVACCLANGGCLDNLSAAACSLEGGVAQGPGSTCLTAQCGPVREACCLPAGGCQQLTRAACLQGGGSPQGSGTDCSQAVCAGPGQACCRPDGSCADNLTADACQAQGGSPQGALTRCIDVQCGSLQEACCLPDGDCAMMLRAACFAAGGSPGGSGSTCAAGPCPAQVQACCRSVGLCSEIDPLRCTAEGGIPQGPGSTCAGFQCPRSRADFDGDGDVDADDLSSFNACVSGPELPYGDPGCGNRDLDGDGDVDHVDFAMFQACFSGANQPADPSCGATQACCLPDGTCANLDAAVCPVRGGSLQGPGTACADVLGTELRGADTAPGDSFGLAIALQGQTLVAGAYLHDRAPVGNANEGAAYVFVRGGGGWTQQAKLVADDATPADAFGVTAAIDGDTIALGAITANGPGGNDQGAVYVFVRSGTTWTQQARLTASDAAAGDWFGHSLGLDGDTLVVGAMQDDDVAGVDQGSAYVFVRSGTVWSQQAKLTAGVDAAAGSQFGFSVALSGNTALIGSPRDDSAAGDAGAAYVFVRAGAVWSRQARLTNLPEAAAGDSFGFTVALSGNTAILGSPLDDDAAGGDQGSAAIFVRSGNTWSRQARLFAGDAAAGDQFGYSTAIDTGIAAVGARLDDGSAGSNQGSAYVFTGGPVWVPAGHLFAPDGGGGDQLGRSVAVHNRTLAAGANLHDHAGTDSGAVYVFRLPCPD